MHYPIETRPTLEKNWSNQQALAHLSREDHDLWSGHRHVQRLLIGMHKGVLIHYQVAMDSGANIRAIYHLENIECDMLSGVKLTLVERRTGNLIVLRHGVPQRLPNSSVFVWVTFFPDLQINRLAHGNFATCLAIATKCHTRPENRKVGTDHLLSLPAFRNLHPAHNKTNF